MKIDKLVEFAAPFYKDKDLMHGLSHIELVIKYVDKIIAWGGYEIDYEKTIIAAYFHGFIYSHEDEARKWLKEQNFTPDDIDFILKVANESLRSEIPSTLEGKVLHDAHVIEGGEVYLLTKCLLTGTARGQTLMETIDYIEAHVIDNNKCYLPETIPILEKANKFAKDFIIKLKQDLI